MIALEEDERKATFRFGTPAFLCKGAPRDFGDHGVPSKAERRPSREPDREWPPVDFLLQRYQATLPELRLALKAAQRELDSGRRDGWACREGLRDLMNAVSHAETDVAACEAVIAGLQNPGCVHWHVPMYDRLRAQAPCSCPGGRIDPRSGASERGK